MKKVLALVLAVVLAFGMTTVAFAATKAAFADFDDSALYVLDDKDLVQAKDYDGNLMTLTSGALAPNTTYYIQITEAYSKAIVTDKVTSGDPSTVLDSGKVANKISTYSDLRVRTTIDEGGAYIASKPAFVIKDGVACISFKTADKYNKDAADITMSFMLYKGGDEASKTVELAATSVAYQTLDASSVFTVKDAGAMVAFNDVEDTEIYFSKNADVYFAVNAKGQKDLFLRLDTGDDAMEDKYPEASMEFFYFAGNNNTFRRSGVLHLPADMVENKDGKLVAPYLYENVGGKLTKIAGGEADKKAGPTDVKYDEDLGEFTFKTNKLGKYVVSDIALKETASSTTDTTDGAETNPDTGANDFVGLAVALAVVSVAGIAVAKRK